MNAKYKNLYQELVSRDMTDLDENSFYNEYSQNDEKFSELYSYLDSNELTSLDPETFKLEYFGTPIIKKKSQVESTESNLEVGSSERLSTTTTRPSVSSTSGKTETFTGYPGKEKNKYDFKESDGVAHWYEPNPKKNKALTELNSMRNAPPKPGPTGHGSMPAFSPEEIKRKELQYNKIPSKKIIEDDARVRALNKHFGKNASLDPIDQVYTNYDEQKKDNEYRVNDNNWQRKVPGAKSWTTVTDERAVNALNRRYGKEVKYKAELKSVKQEPKLKFADVNTSLVSKTEEDAVGILSKKYGKYGFTFEQSGYGTDYVIAYNKDKTKEITVGFDEANPEEALKLKSFLEQNASKEKSNAALELEKKIKSLNSTHTSPGAKGYDILDRTNTLKYVLSDEYKTKFSSLSFDEMEDQINNYIKTSFQKSEDLDKFWGSDAYKIFKEKKKEEFGAIDERIDLLYTELQSAKSSGNKSDVKNINSKINTYLSEDVIQDQVKNYSIQLNDLDKSAKILASDQKKYSQSVEDFNKLSQSGQMTQEEFDLAKKNLEDQAEKLGTRADFLMSSGKSIQNDQKKLNVVAGKYFTKKEKAGSFGGGIVNSILTGISKSIIEVPSTFVISLTESSGSEYFKLSPEEKQYYKDKGYSKDQTINLLVNNKIKDFKAETRKNLIDVLGADQTTQEYMKSADRGLFAKSIFGVAESAPAMLMGFGGYAASFTGLASQAYSSIEDEMLNDADFETSSVGERAVVAVPYALLMGVLENFGLKNVVKGSSFTGGVVKDILINSMKQMPKDGTKGLLQNIMTKEVKSVLAKGAFKIVNGAIAEFETGATQALVLDIGLKSLYNKISQSGMTEEQISNLSGGEMFATPDTLGELTSTVLEDGLAEAIGGAAMSTFTTVVTGLKNGNISLYNEDDLNYLKEISQDTEFKKIIVANLKTEMLKGNLTKSEAQERLDAMNQLSSVIESIPDGLSEKDQISAVNILSEKNRLEKERQGKDPALVTAQTDRINEINEELKNISKNATKEDNIVQQEGGISEYQGTGEGQPEVGVSEGGQRETTVNEADSGDSTVASKVQQEEQVATYRAEEQAELLKAIPKIEKYKVNGKIDKTLMPKTVLAKYNSIYNKYDKLISPLLETTGEVVIDKPVITTNTTDEVQRVKSLTFEAEDGATFNIDGTKYEGVGLVVPVDSMNTTTEELTPEMVADFVAERQKMIGDAGVVKAGIYKFPNSNQVSIDLSVVIPETSREQALEFARLAGQESLFDLETFENIKTGATGENPMKFTPEQHREISKALKEGRMPNVFGATTETTNNLLTKENVREFASKQKTMAHKLIVKAAKMVLSAIPGIKIYIHNNGQEMVSAVDSLKKQSSKQQLTKEEKTGIAESSGIYVDGAIHIDLESATIKTVFHEAFHALTEKMGMSSEATLLMAKGLKNIISDKKIKAKLIDFISQYETAKEEFKKEIEKENKKRIASGKAAMNEKETDEYVVYLNDLLKSDEFLAELTGILSEAEQELTTTKLQQFKTLINNIAKKLGLPVIFSASATAQDAADFINTMSKKLRTGEEIEINDPGDGGEVGTFNIPKIKFTKAKSVSEDSRDFIIEFVEDLDIRELNGEKFITNMYDFTNAGKTDLGNGFEINMLGGKNYVPLMMSLNNKKIGEVSNLAAFNTKAQAETFVRNAEMSGAKIFAPHSGTLSNSWQFQQHTFAELSSLVLDNEILTKDKLIDVFNDAIKTNKSNQKEFNQFAEKYGENIKNFDSFKSDPKKIIELLDIKNNYSPNLRKALNNAISANKEFQKAIGIKNKQEFYNRIMDPLNQGMTGGEIMNIVKFDPNTFKIVQTKESDIDNHPSFGWTLLAKINGIYQPTELYKSSDITDTYTKYNKGGEEVSRKSEEPKFEQKNVSSSAGAIPKVAEFKESSKIKFQKNKTDKLTAPVAGNKLFNEPLKQALDIAKSYMKSIGKEYTPVEKITKLDEDRAKNISDAYDKMKDDPTDPEVKAAYEVMAKETLDQYDAITAKGYKLEINNNEPYSSSEDMINDLRDNNRMKIFSTESGFGEEPITDKQREENILLKDSGRKDANGETLLVNDVFRFVHDFFGHAKLGNSFGPIGEENAWRVHSEMYSPEAKKAMTSETRGQNSWVNFSGVNDAAFKKREKARQLRKEGKIDQANQMVGEVYDEMKFADQKIGLLPSFAVEEGAPSKIKKQLTTDKKVNPGLEAALKELGETKEQRESWRKNNKVNQKQKRNPIVEQAVKDYYNEKINQEQYLDIVAKNQPIKPFKEVPTLPSLEDITNSLDISKVATGIIGLTKNLEDGEKVASRLDIPAYEDYDTWVVSLHDGNKEGKSIAYGQTAVLKNVDFKTFPGSAIRIAMGTQNKSTIGRMFGDWVNEDPKAVHARAKELMNDPAWTQVGMNPFRYSWFYDKSDGMPVASADEVIQVGALVLAKNAKKVLPSDPIFETKSAKGGKIKFQKTTTKQEAIQKAKDKYELSVEKRGNSHQQGVTASLGDLQKSDWYVNADDTAREDAVREIKAFFGEKLKKAPSVSKILGKPKPETQTKTVNALRKEFFTAWNKSAREAKGDLNQKRKMLAATIKGLVKLGRLTARQAATIINRVSVVNLDNQVMVGRLADYAARVFEKADYQERLSRAFSFRKGIRRLLKGDIQAEVVGMAKKFSKIDPSMVDDIEKYLEMAEIVKNAIKPSRVNKKDLDVNMRESMNIDSVSEFTNDAIENQERILKEELLAVHSELVDAGVIDDKMSLSEIELTINSLKEKEEDANYKADILTFLSKRIDTMSAIIKDILIFKINPMTGEEVALTEKNIDLISRMLNIDINNVSIKEAIFIAEAMDNFINNNITSSVEAVIEKHEGVTELENLIADKVVASPLRKYFSPYLGQFMSEQVASMPILFEKLFVGAKKGLMVAKKMGWTALINGVNKAEKMFNTTVDVYFKQYSKTKPNGKSFNDAENVYERGMLAFLSRNVSGTVTQQSEELKRRVEVLKESVKSLLEGSSKEQKMGELYQKVYDKLNVESGDIDIIHANADKINRSAVGWWINQWGTTYSDLSDISLSVYNTVLSSDTSYTTDRYKLLSKSTSKEIIDPKTGSFGRDIEFLDKNKAGVMMPSTKPSASAVSNASRYISLDFDVNNTSAYKGALIDINTAAAIRKIDGFINSKNLAKLIPTEEDREIFTGRIADYIQAAKNKMPVQSDKMRLLDQLTNFLGGIGVAKALGGIDQVVKQTLPIALSTFVNSGRFDLVMPGSSASVWIDSLGMAISNRGQESQSTIESVDRRLEKASGIIDKSTNAFVDVQQFWLKYFLSKPDVFIAKSSFISYYKQYLSNNNQSTDIDWDTHNVNQDAADYAMTMVDRQQNISDTKMAGKIFSSQNSTIKIMRKIFLPFASFSLNQKSRMVSDIKVLGMNSGASKQDRKIAIRSLASLPFEMALYQSMSLAIRLGYLAIAKGIIGAVADDDDEEKERLLGIEISKELKNATKYPLRSMITDFFSPAPILDHLVVGGANALLSQLEDKEMINDAVDKKNLMLEVLGKDKMDEDQKEKFIKKFKKDHEYQLFNDEKKSYGTIGIGTDLYYEVIDNAKTAYTGKYTQDYMGNESERYLLPKDRENIQNAVIFETLFALGILPRDVNTVTKNIIKLSKKNSLTETQYEKYKAIGKETGGKVTGWKMDLAKSKSKKETTLEELEWIKEYGGLTEKQGQEYVKLSKLVDEVSYIQLMDLQSGMTADKIIKSY